MCTFQIDMKTDTTIRLSLKYSFSSTSSSATIVPSAGEYTAPSSCNSGRDGLRKKEVMNSTPIHAATDTIHAAAVGSNQKESTARTIARAAAHRMIGAPSLWIFILSQIGFQSVNIMLK